MRQHWKVVNVTKRELLHPHRFDEGLKFCEFANSSGGTLAGLAFLLAAPSSMGSGGGDLTGPHSDLLGSWIGDKVVILGDYNDDAEYAGLYSEAEDISLQVITALQAGGL